MTTVMHLTRIVLAGLFAVCGSSAQAPEGDRWAVIIGIDNYQDLGKLTTARNDAKALVKALLRMLDLWKIG